MGTIAAFPACGCDLLLHLGPMGSVALVLLAAAVLLFVQIVATTTKEAMRPEDNVQAAVLDAEADVVRSWVRLPPCTRRRRGVRGGFPPS